MSTDRREDAESALLIARQRLADGKLDVARRLANKSKAMFPTPGADELLAEIERREAGGGVKEETEGRASGAEVHPSAAGTHQRAGHQGSSAKVGGEEKKARECTPEQRAVVKRVRACKVTEYYAILDREQIVFRCGFVEADSWRAVQKTCTDNDVRKAYRKVCRDVFKGILR
jgi:DnaJ family protein B protein 12